MNNTELNNSIVRTANVPFETVQGELLSAEVAVTPVVSTIRCNSCFQGGHQRATNRLCPNYRGSRVCSYCSLDTHQSIRSRLCPGNIVNALRIARRIEVIASIARHDSGEMNVECAMCGAMLWMQEKVASSSLASPQFQICCGKGKYVMTRYPPTPLILSNMLTANNNMSKELFENIRAYNSALSFTSLGVQMDHSVANRAGGAYNFRIHGSVYHRIGSLFPSENARPAFAQIYIYDAAEEIRNRHAVASHVNIDTLEILQNMMHSINPFVKDFKTMAALAQEQNGGISDIKMLFKAEGTPDPRRYNAPSSNTEIGILILGSTATRDGGERPSNRDVVLHLTEEGARSDSSNSSNLRNISELNQCYDPMHYVLLFPHGNAGWSIDTVSVDGRANVTAQKFYAFHLMYRKPSDATIPTTNFHLHLFGPLFQQYIVDMYAKIEQGRLNFVRFNQKRLRCEVYQGLQDAVSNGDADLSAVGNKVILPSSFLGSPRSMVQLYQDALSIVRRFGKPDLFITFTCNPGWPEIQKCLLYGQSPSDRPDLCARVFHMKLKALLYDIKEKQIFGKVIGHIHTIEYQKRGLPHAHILIILAPTDKPRTVEDIDALVSAELPNKDLYPQLYATVLKFMTHGPCGIEHGKPNAKCMKNGKCSKRFPKTYNGTTKMPNEEGSGGYPEYRRRMDGRVASRDAVTNSFKYDNRWVVPYNPYLCQKYDSHINVEICATVTSIKYVYKYVYKGHDMATVAVDDVDDEIERYVDARYVSASEACWRIFSFSMHEEYPHHQRLAIHLPEEQPFSFHELDNAIQVLERGLQDTTLTAWFNFNELNEDAREYLYIEFPERHVWLDKENQWKIREKGFGGTIGRIFTISPRQSEKYHLRMLLHHVRGARSFEDLRTVYDIEYATFKEAAAALNLLDTDDEWDRCISEAATYQMPLSLRSLFTIILLFGYPTDPFHLWSRHCNALSEDYLHKERLIRNDPLLPANDFIYQCALLDIEDIMTKNGQSLLSISGFTLPDTDIRQMTAEMASMTEEERRLPPVIRDQVILTRSSRTIVSVDAYNFNTSQLSVYNEVMSLVFSNDIYAPKMAFVDGPGGTGKTYLFNAILESVRMNRMNGGISLAVASSGTAALLLRGGSTAHSMFGIPLSISFDSMCNIKPNSDKGQLIRMAKMVIWDEASMISRDILEAVDRTFKDVCKTINPLLEFAPFGGKVMIFGGDFRQVLPVVPRGRRSDIVGQCINRSGLWRHAKVLKLSVNMRVLQASVSNDVTLASTLDDFSKYLLRIGDGVEQIVRGTQFDVTLPESMMIRGTNTTTGLMNAVYHGFSSNTYQLDKELFLTSRAILTPKNSNVSMINDHLIDLFEGNPMDLYSADFLGEDETNTAFRYPIEFLNSIDSGGLPPHHLKLKVGCPIMMLRNLNPKLGLCNGTRLIVLRLHHAVITAKIVSGSNIGEIVMIPRIKIDSDISQSSVAFTRKQFPVRLAFAMTINKSQGQTLDFVGLYLPSPVFSHGQLYVAMSRVKSPHSLKVYIEGLSEGGTSTTQNVVYPEVFMTM